MESDERNRKAAAYGVHLLTATGAALGFLALVAVFAGNLTQAFIWLAIALVVDTIDGPLARKLGVKARAPRYSGDTLDLVVDYLTYVIVPAAMIARGGLMAEPFALIAALLIMFGSALYFADTSMKTDDWWFKGFPAVWNIVAFYLALFSPPLPVSVGIVIILVAGMFLPIPFIHPVRVRKFRPLTLTLLAVWGLAAALALMADLNPPTLVKVALAVTGIYFIGIGITRRPQIANVP